MASYNKSIVMVALWHNGHRYIELHQQENGVFNFFCNLCNHSSNSITDLMRHMKERIHKDNLLKAKNTVLRQQRFPFYDGVLLFGHSRVNKFPPFHPIFDHIGDKVSASLKDLSQMELQERIDHYSSTILNSLVNDPEMLIDTFNYGYPEPSIDEGCHRLQIYAKPEIKNVGNLNFFMRYGYDIMNSDFEPALGIEKEFHDIYSIWCEWGNVNPQPNVVDEDDQHDHDDDDRNRVNDPIDAMIVMKFTHGMGSFSDDNASEPKMCFLCDRRMNVGNDVAALLGSQNDRIICCNRKLFNARNKGKEIGGSINIIR
ncbi:hypothetical protein A2U01_0007839, partial [Trifolium medium]|nr:hypothetical protein [Trifolium medium]